MAKYLVETYYTCTFKVNHYLDDINENELKNLEKRDDGKFEVLDVKLDNRKTKSLDPKNNKIEKSHDLKKYKWQKPHQPNLTGTDSAYYPNKNKNAVEKKYKSWKD